MCAFEERQLGAITGRSAWRTRCPRADIHRGRPARPFTTYSGPSGAMLLHKQELGDSGPRHRAD
jgi:hypothetical protein